MGCQREEHHRIGGAEPVVPNDQRRAWLAGVDASSGGPDLSSMQSSASSRKNSTVASRDSRSSAERSSAHSRPFRVMWTRSCVWSTSSAISDGRDLTSDRGRVPIDQKSGLGGRVRSAPQGLRAKLHRGGSIGRSGVGAQSAMSMGTAVKSCANSSSTELGVRDRAHAPVVVYESGPITPGVQDHRARA